VHEYNTARKVGRLVAAVGWATTIVGAILLLLALDTIGSGFGLVVLTPALGITIGGLLLVCQGQLTQAVVDTASNTGELVRLIKEQPQTVSESSQSRDAHMPPITATQPSSVSAATASTTRSSERAHEIAADASAASQGKGLRLDAAAQQSITNTGLGSS
jgi:hypothetical protein